MSSTIHVHHLARNVAASFAVLLLAACGGGGGSNPGTPTLPQITIADASTAEGNSGTHTLDFNVTLSAAASGTVTVDYATANGTATAGSDYVAASGTLTFAAGQTSKTISVTINGDTTYEPDETLLVNLTNPANATIADAQATGTITNDDAQPAIAIAIADASTAEGNSGTHTLDFNVTLSAAASGTVTVDYATANGTASAGSDYVATSGTLTFAAGQTSKTISVTINGDTTYEPDETLLVNLTNAANATIADAQATGTITNDDAQPAISIASASTAEGNSGTKVLAFNATLSNASYQTVTVNYATANGTATAGSDYVAASGMLTFAPGTTSQAANVTINGDTTVEPDETFKVNLTNPVNATLATAQATGTILDDDGTPLFGLDARPSNTSCLAPVSPGGGAGVGSSDAFPGAPAFGPATKILQAPGDGSRWFILEQTGKIKVLNVATSTISTWLDWTAKVNPAEEGGMLGMAFHPNFPATKEVFLSYTTYDGSLTSNMHSVLSRVTLDNTTAPTSFPEQVIMTVDQPGTNHNGGDIAFDDAANYLYYGLGDGGADSGDPFNHAQNTTDLLGSILRIDVIGTGAGYSVPADNPFAGNPKCNSHYTAGANAQNCPEIYAWGFRNPYRWSFDEVAGRLWVGDVGQNTWEEVDIVDKGKNYGWHCREGAHDFSTDACFGPFVDPVAEYSHSSGIAIIGGFVYRGAAIPSLQGRYIFGDYGSGSVRALQSANPTPASPSGYDELFQTGHLLTSFGRDVDGELYFIDNDNGRIRKIVPSGGNPDLVATSLKATGCVDLTDPSKPAAGLIPYGINAPFWSDGAAKERYLALPNGQTIGVNGTTNDWDLPAGSVILKLFRLAGTPIETRLLMKHTDGVWRGYTYEWNGSLTDATRISAGKTKLINGQQWIYPSEAECLQCHTSAAGFSLGPETAQLNGSFTYPSTARTANQIATLDHIGVFTSSPGLPASLPALADPADVNQTLDARARAYLHTNCSQCHRPGGPTPVSMDFRYATALSAMGACNVAPSAGDLGLTSPKLIKPGDAANSTLRERMSRRDGVGMPPLASSIADAAGVALITSWINSLSSCN